MSDELADLLTDVWNGFQERLQKMDVLAELALPPFPARLLNAIGRRSGISQQTLAAATGRDKAQVARAVKELEGRGLIVRVTDASDRRTQRLSATADGARIADRIGRQRDIVIAGVLSQLSHEEVDRLHRGLGRLRRALADAPPAFGGGAAHRSVDGKGRLS